MFFVTIVLFLAWLGHHIYLTSIFIGHNSQTNNKVPFLPVDIIVCQHNELQNIPKFIEFISAQSYSHITVYIIDDYSTDSSLELATQLSATNAAIKVFSNPKGKGKKEAQEYGISISNAPLILFTDMDCRSKSKYWVTSMAQSLLAHDVVLAYGPFFKFKNPLSKLQRYDCAWIAIQYFATTIIHKPYMAVGRNLAIRRDVYEITKHQIKAKDILSGDDDMLIQALSSNNDVGIQTSIDSFMYSNAESTYSRWLSQKTRQIQTSFHYKLSDQIHLGLSAILSIVAPIYFLIAPFICKDLPTITISLLYLVLLWIIKGKALLKLRENDLIPWVPILELVYSFHLIIFSLYSLFKKSKTWK